MISIALINLHSILYSKAVLFLLLQLNVANKSHTPSQHFTKCKQLLETTIFFEHFVTVFTADTVLDL